MNSPARFFDHTCLQPDADRDRIAVLCEEAVEYGFAAVCIPPIYLPEARIRLYGSGVELATVVGFPLGYNRCDVKVCETIDAVNAGATEIDMVIAAPAVLAGDFAACTEEIAAVVAAAGEARVKVILECCRLNSTQKAALVDCAIAAGAAFVKTSTGFAASGATLPDVRLLAAAAAGRIGVKAAGGIRTWSECREYLAAGATRIGSSRSVEIMQEWLREEGA